MNPVEAALHAIARELDSSGRSWALVGGLAVSARAEPRTTRDVDVAVMVHDDLDAERLVRHLTGTGAYRVGAVIEQRAVKRLGTVRLHPTHKGRVIVDLLFASSGIEQEVAMHAERIEIVPGLPIPIATIGHLIALKVLARDDRSRPQDIDDLRALIRESSPRDLDLARASLRLIETRGYHRDCKLVEAFDDVLGTNPTSG